MEDHQARRRIQREKLNERRSLAQRVLAGVEAERNALVDHACPGGAHNWQMSPSSADWRCTRAVVDMCGDYHQCEATRSMHPNLVEAYQGFIAGLPDEPDAVAELSRRVESVEDRLARLPEDLADALAGAVQGHPEARRMRRPQCGQESTLTLRDAIHAAGGPDGVAALAGIGRATIFRAMRGQGKSVPAWTLSRIASAIGITHEQAVQAWRRSARDAAFEKESKS